MASNLITSITLNKDYSSPTVSRPGISDLSLWSGSGITFQDSYAIEYVNDPYSGNLTSGIFDDVYAEYGTITFSFTLNSEIDQVLSLILLSNGNGVASQNFNVITGVNTISIDIDTSFSFDQISIIVGYGSGIISDLSMSSVDQFANFNSGDKIHVYWDSESNDYSVQIENFEDGSFDNITNGPSLQLSQSQVSGINFIFQYPAFGYLSFYKFCSGTSLNEFFFKLDAYSFPYVNKNITENSPSCSTDNVVCNIIYSSQPIITKTSNKFSSDGSVQLFATSNNADFVYPVKYSTQPPIDISNQYNNISNTSGLFENLSVGSYIFYAIDRYNCFIGITVKLESDANNAYGAKYIVRYLDKMTHEQSTITIYERGFDGVPYYSTASDDPFVMVHESGDFNNKFDAIIPTSGELTLISERSFQYIGLFSQDDKKFKVLFVRGLTNWSGFLQSSLYQEPYSPNPIYPVQLLSIDNLNLLSEYPFLDESGNIISGLRSLLYIIALCLRKTNLDLNIISAINKYSDEMDSGDSDDPLNQSYINCDCFYEDDGTPFKMDIVLTYILKPFGAYVKQNNSKWNIVERDCEMQDYKYREFDKDGNYIGNGTITRPDLNIVTPGLWLSSNDTTLLAQSNHTLDIIPAYGRMSIVSKLRPAKSIFPTSLDRWISNINSSVGYSEPYDLEDSKDKGIAFKNITFSSAYILSPQFRIKTLNDSLIFSFEYKAALEKGLYFQDPITGLTYNTLNIPDPPFIKLRWRLILNVAGVDLYYSDRLKEWTRSTSVGTSVTSLSIPVGDTNPTSRTLTTQAGLKIIPGDLILVSNSEFKYFRGVCFSYDNTTGILVVSTYSSMGTGTYASWSVYVGGFEYIDNYIFINEFNDKFDNFSSEINLPSFSAITSVDIQSQIIVAGSNLLDANNITEIRQIPTATLKTGYKIRCKDIENPSYYLAWYELTSGTDEEDLPRIIRGDDYNNNSNAVVWKQIYQEPSQFYRYVQYTREIDIQNAKVSFKPNRKDPITSETITFVNNENYRENISVQLDLCDIPSSIVNDEIYINIFRYSDGSPTINWKRRLVSESDKIQSLLLKSYGNQYNKPTWRLNGSFLIPDANFTSIIRQQINAIDFDVINPDFLSVLEPWENYGTGTDWVNPDGTKAFAEAVSGDTKYLRQQVANLKSGERYRIDLKFTRSNSEGQKIDRVMAVFFQNNDVVQRVLLYDGVSVDGIYSKGILFNLDRNATHISFIVENIINSSGSCDYEFDYFRPISVNIVRYFYFNSFKRSDRSNLYDCEIVQLIPLFASTDTNVDDTGGGSTNGPEDAPDNGGGEAGSGFSGAFSNGFSGGFDTIEN